eukprot:scaffold24673_cov43-Prasinocladus_malaysianus.AAC.2
MEAGYPVHCPVDRRLVRVVVAPVGHVGHAFRHAPDGPRHRHPALVRLGELELKRHCAGRLPVRGVIRVVEQSHPDAVGGWVL